MRWSLIFYLFTTFAALLILDGTFALPAPRDGALALDTRAVTRSGGVAKSAQKLRKTAARAGGAAKKKPAAAKKPAVAKKKPAAAKKKPAAAKKQPAARKKASSTTAAKKGKAGQAITPKSLKKSSNAYRKAAMKNPHMYGAKGGKLQKVKTPGKMASGNYHADHLLEAQTASKALSGAGHTQKSLGKQKMNKVKNTLNAPKNMAMVDGNVNTAKGRVTKAALNGGTPKPADVKKSQAYMKDTKSRGKETAAEVDKIVGGNSVQTKHNQVLKKAGIKREVISEGEDLE